MEEALHDTPLYCQFAGCDAGITRLPDETTILRFRHLLEEHKLSIKLIMRPGKRRALDKNTAQLITLLALSNLSMARRQLMGVRG